MIVNPTNAASTMAKPELAKEACLDMGGRLVPLVTIGDILSDSASGPVDVMKIDVEGFEPFEGAARFMADTPRERHCRVDRMADRRQRLGARTDRVLRPLFPSIEVVLLGVGEGRRRLQGGEEFGRVLEVCGLPLSLWR